MPGRPRLIACLFVFWAIAVPVHAATITITVENLVISRAEATARVGDTLELVNKDVLAHTATARNGDFDVMMPPKKTVTSVLKKPGTIEYYCRFHPNMKAALTIAPWRAVRTAAPSPAAAQLRPARPDRATRSGRGQAHCRAPTASR